MSMHIYSAGDIRIILGYDRPLNCIFCSIQSGADYVYTNIWDKNAGTTQRDVSYYRQIIAKYNVSVPEEMFKEVESDLRNQVGNRVVDWSDT